MNFKKYLGLIALLFGASHCAIFDITTPGILSQPGSDKASTTKVDEKAPDKADKPSFFSTVKGKFQEIIDDRKKKADQEKEKNQKLQAERDAAKKEKDAELVSARLGASKNQTVIDGKKAKELTYKQEEDAKKLAAAKDARAKNLAAAKEKDEKEKAQKLEDEKIEAIYRSISSDWKKMVGDSNRPDLEDSYEYAQKIISAFKKLPKKAPLLLVEKFETKRVETGLFKKPTEKKEVGYKPLGAETVKVGFALLLLFDKNVAQNMFSKLASGRGSDDPRSIIWDAGYSGTSEDRLDYLIENGMPYILQIFKTSSLKNRMSKDCKKLLATKNAELRTIDKKKLFNEIITNCFSSIKKPQGASYGSNKIGSILQGATSFNFNTGRSNEEVLDIIIKEFIKDNTY